MLAAKSKVLMPEDRFEKLVRLLDRTEAARQPDSPHAHGYRDGTYEVGYENPFHVGTPEYREYLRGYVGGLMERGARLVVI